MKVNDLSIFRIALPLRREHKCARTVQATGYGYAVVKLITDNGVIGYGEANTLPQWGGDFDRYYGETGETCEHVIKSYLFPAIEGEDPFNIELIHHKMNNAIRGYPYAKAAVDMALYDIMGKAKDMPVYQLLGGSWRKAAPIAHSLGIMDVEQAVDEAITAVKEGVKHIKIKVGLDPSRDIDVVQKIRKALGPDVSLVVDANQGYSSPKEAIKTIKAMEPSNISYVEQPVEGLYQMRTVTSAVSTPIMADESAWGPADALEIAILKAADFISVYTTKPGGLFLARQVACIAQAAGMRCNVNGSLEFGVGNAANLHLIASTPNANLPCVIPVTTIKGKEQVEVVGRVYSDDIIKKPFDYDDGYLRVPEGPGLGIEVDEEKLQEYSVS